MSDRLCAFVFFEARSSTLTRISVCPRLFSGHKLDALKAPVGGAMNFGLCFRKIEAK